MQPVAAKRTEPAPDTEDRQAAPSADVDADGDVELDPAVVALTERDEHGQPRFLLALLQMQEEADALTLRATTAESALEEANAKIAAFKEAEIVALADAALSTWGEKRGLTLASRPHLLSHARSDRAGFEAMYPRPHPQSQAGPHIGRLVAANGRAAAADTTHEAATKMRDDAAIPTIEALADKFIADAKARGVSMTREEAFSRGFTERQSLVSAARRMP
jgi:hypothetical protein